MYGEALRCISISEFTTETEGYKARRQLSKAKPAQRDEIEVCGRAKFYEPLPVRIE